MPRLKVENPIQPIGAEGIGDEYKVLEAIQDELVSQLIVKQNPMNENICN